MKEKIERLAKGMFEYDMPELLVSERELHVYVEAGLKTEGKVCVKNSASQRMKGVLYVTGKLLVLDDVNFVGTECELGYRVDAAMLLPGEVHQGTISIISDCGESQLPFYIHVTEPSYQSSIGVVKDLFQFTNLARLNWKEAEEFFASDKFTKIVLCKEKRYISVYEHLMESPDKARAMEEFLVLVHKKKACEFKVLQQELELEAGREKFQEKLIVQKEQWGYTRFRVTTASPYIMLEKSEYTMEDFVNGQAEISFVVEADKMHPGRYFTEIVCEDARQTVKIPVTLHCHKDEEEEYPWKNARRMECKLMEQYLQFRNDKVSGGVFLAESGRILESLLAILDKKYLDCEQPEQKAAIEEKKQRYELYRAYLAVVDHKNRNNEDAYEAALRKRSLFERNQQMLFYCATLYLEAMKSRNRIMVEEYAEYIRILYEQEKTEDLLLWFLLYMDKRFEGNRLLRYEAIKEHCRKGKYSPVLLYEAAVAWSADPLMVHSLTNFECHVMRYLVENRMVTKELAIQFAYLSDQNTDRGVLQLRLLKQLYDQFQHKDILLVVCRKLITQRRRNVGEHKYLRQGVKEQLKLDRLYEYYIHTLDKSENQVIDQQVLLYFSFSSTLPKEDMAYIYSYVVRNKDSNPAVYRAYLKKMEQFAVNQMKAGEVSGHLAVLYADVLRASIIDREMAQTLPDIIFTYQLECHSTSMKSVCVSHKEKKLVRIIPLEEENGIKQALVPLYTENAEIFLMDEDGNRYLMTAEDKLYRLMHEENLLDVCYEIGSDNKKLLLHVAEKNQNYNKFDRTLIDLKKQMSHMTGLKEEVKNACVLSLVDYYYENYDGELLESYLRSVDLELLDTRDRERMMEMMVLRDMYDEVIESVEKFGCATMQPKRVAKLCIRGIFSPREEKDRTILLAMGIYAFHNGRVEDRLLQYLADRYNGTTVEMYELWQAAKQQELDTTELEERLLGQMLFAESYVDDSFSVFLSYYTTGMNRKLIRAYLSYCAYKYFVKDRMTTPELFEMLKKESFLDNSQICVLALLKFYSGKEILTEAEKSFVDFHIQRFVQKKMVFAFFKDFENQVTLPACVTDKYYVEYRTNPKNKVTLHYSCRLEEDQLKAEPMTDIGYGVYVKELILFYGESLQYFISQESENGLEMVESRMVHYTELEHAAGNTKYEKINEILLAQEMQDEKTLYNLLERYSKEEYAVKRHFSPV